MAVRNMGVDVALAASILEPADRKLSWTSSLRFSFNENRLRALPRGLDQLIVGDRLLKVGSRTDQYWLLQNDGIYAADEEVPLQDGTRRTFNGITLKAGDPNWRDQNNDNRITNEDKV